MTPELAQVISGASFAFSLPCAISFPITNRLCLVWSVGDFPFLSSPIMKAVVGESYLATANLKKNPIHLIIAVGSGMDM